MIVADTDILSALAKIGRLPLLCSLFRVTRLRIVPGVFKEIAHSVTLERSWTTEILSLISTAQIEVIALTQEEPPFVLRSLFPWAAESVRALRLHESEKEPCSRMNPVSLTTADIIIFPAS